MNVSLFQAAAALNANSRWQESIAQNLASSSVPGFKKQELSFSAIQAGLMSPSPAKFAGVSSHFLLPKGTVTTNFEPGVMKRTDLNTDVAIQGRGFFEIRLPNGTTGYTRDGEFQQNAQGLLTTKQGHFVLGDAGPIQLDPNNSAVLSISPTGEVSQGAELKGKLKLADFNDLQLLTPVGNGIFLAANSDLQPVVVSNPSIQCGFLEGANTSAVAEMVNLISAMRMYETNQKVIQMQDDRMGRTISELGNP